MMPGVQPTNSEVIIEQVGTMTPVFNAIVDQKFQYDIASTRALERDILTVEGNHFAKASESIFDSCPIAARMLEQSLCSNIFYVKL